VQIVEPGYKKSRIAPLIEPSGLTHARCSVRTPYGLLISQWQVAEGELKMSVTVPANTTAEVVIPATSAQAVREGNAPAVSVPGVKQSAFKDGHLTLLVGSGHYEFIAR
jgi:alpha-L-rhamnosidase